MSGGSATGALPLSQLLSGGGGGAGGNRVEDGGHYSHSHSHAHRNGSTEVEERRPSVQGYSYSNLIRNYETPSAHPAVSGSSRVSPYESSSERRNQHEEERLSYPYTRGLSPRRTERQPSHPVRPFLTSPAESLEVYGGPVDYAREDHFASMRAGRYYADERVSPQSAAIRGHREYEYDRDRAARRESESVFGPMPTGRTAGRPLPPSSISLQADHDRDREYRNHVPLTNGHAPTDYSVVVEREGIYKAKRARLNELVRWEARRRASPTSNGAERTFYGYKRERERSSGSLEPGTAQGYAPRDGSPDPLRRGEDELPRLIRADSYGARHDHHLPAGMALPRPDSRTGMLHDHPVGPGSIFSEPREEYRTLPGQIIDRSRRADGMMSMSPLPEPTVLPVPPSLIAYQGMSGDWDNNPDAQPVVAKKQNKRQQGRPKKSVGPIAPLLAHRELGYTAVDAEVDDDLMHLMPGDGPDDMDGLDPEDDSADGPKKKRRAKQEPSKEMSPETRQRWERESWPTKGLVNKDGSLRRKPGPPKGIPKVKKPAARKSEAGVNGDGDEIRHQALLNASGLVDPDASVHGEFASQDGIPAPAVDTPPKKKKRTKKPITSQSVSRASSPAADLASEADSQFAAEVDHDLEDMLGGPKPSKGKRKARDVSMFDEVSASQAEERAYGDDPFSGDEQVDPLPAMHAEMQVDPEPEAELEPEPEAELAPEPEPEPEEEIPVVIPLSEFLQFDQPDVEITERVARARYLKAELMRASIWKDIVTNQIPPVSPLS